MQRYITENMLPGVTLNPSMVDNIQSQNQSYVYDEPSIVNFNKPVNFHTGKRNYTEPMYREAPNNVQSINLFNVRRPVQIPNP